MSRSARDLGGLFVGARALSHVVSLLESGVSRVALIGPPGVGKTRLATEAARAFAAAGSPRAWVYADLSDARHDEVLGAVVDALGILEPVAGLDPLDHLIDRVADRPPTVVVLDGCDRLETEVAALAAGIAGTTPLQVLMTSRSAIGGVDVLVDVAPLEQGDAIALFRARAEAQRRDADLRDEAAIGDIVRAFDNLPFAIELAASRIRILGVSQIRARALESSPVIAKGALEAALFESFEPLAPPEREALAQCTVFRGGFDLEAAEAVIRAEGDVIDLLQGLRDRSLVQLVPTSAGSTRFTLLAVVRSFVEARGEHDASRAAAADRHADVYLARCERAAEDHHWRGDPTARALLHAEFENLRVIAERGLVATDDAWLRRALDALFVMMNVAWERRFFAYDALVERAIDKAHAKDLFPRQRARALFARAWAQLAAGRLLRSSESATRSLELAESIGSGSGAAQALHVLAFAHLTGPDKDGVVQMLERARALAAGDGNEVLAGRCQSMIGMALFHAGEPGPARAALEDAQRTHELHGDRVWAPVTEQRIGWLDLYCGDYDAARRRTEHAIEGLERAAYSHAERGLALTNLALLEEREGRLDAALELCDDAIAWLRALSAWPFLGIALGRRAVLQHMRGDLGAAERDFQEGIRYCAVTIPVSAAMNRAQLASLLADMGRLDQARSELSAAEGATGTRSGAEVIALCRAHLLVAEAHQQHVRGEVEGAAASMTRARAIANEPIPPGKPETYRAILALRLFERAFAAGPMTSLAPAAGEAFPEGMLVVSAGCQRFRAPGGSFVDLPARSAQQRILARLVADHAKQGRASIPDLVTAGWSAAEARDRSARARVYVALSTLRTLGLRTVLRRDRRGYFLDPAAAILDLDQR